MKKRTFYTAWQKILPANSYRSLCKSACRTDIRRYGFPGIGQTICCRVYFVFIFLYFSMLFMGCSSSETGIFELEQKTPSQLDSGTNLFVRSLPYPQNIANSYIINPAELADSSVYMQMNKLSPSLFHLQIFFKNITGAYDTPMTILYDPNVIEINLTDTNNIVEGSQSLRLSVIQSKDYVLKAANSPIQTGAVVISQNLLTDFGNFQKYNGISFSLVCRFLLTQDFETALGFDTTSSKILDKQGNAISVNWFGATIKKTSS